MNKKMPKERWEVKVQAKDEKPYCSSCGSYSGVLFRKYNFSFADTRDEACKIAEKLWSDEFGHLGERPHVVGASDEWWSYRQDLASELSGLESAEEEAKRCDPERMKEIKKEIETLNDIIGNTDPYKSPH